MGNIVPAFQNPAAINGWLGKLKGQMQLALPRHMTVDRMARLVLTAFSSNQKLAECSPHSVAASIMTACQLGLEPGVNGQGYLIPYKNTCTFVPGWKGLVDLANRGGRCTVWTGAVYRGDEFDYQLGDNPYVRHRPGDEAVETFDTLEYVYACGRIKGQEVPVIEVWRKSKVLRHLELFNKVGERHYALKDNKLNFEMYARKIPLLQVLKYMPQSIELTAAMAAQHAAEEGRTINIDGATWVTTENPPDPAEGDTGADPGQQQGGPAADAGRQDEAPQTKPELTNSELAKKKPALLKALKAGQSVNEVIKALQTTHTVNQDQQMEIASWADAKEGAPA